MAQNANGMSFLIVGKGSSFGFHCFLARYNLEEKLVFEDYFDLFGLS